MLLKEIGVEIGVVKESATLLWRDSKLVMSRSRIRKNSI